MSTLVYRQPRLLALILLIIIASGVGAFLTMPREEDPTIANRNAVIVTAFPGATAARVEALVTEKIEDELRQLSEINEIRSSSRSGLSVITIELQETITDPEPSFAQVRDALDDARAQFPEGAGDPVFDDDRTYAYTILVALRWDVDSDPNLLILKRLANDLQDRLRNTPGTEIVTVHGAPEEEIIVTLDPAALASLNMTADQVAAAIRGADSKVAAGQLRGAKTIALEVRGALDSLTRIRDIPIARGADGAALQLGDIARVRRALVDPPDSLVLVDGQPAVVVGVRMETYRRVDQWAANVHDVLDEYRQSLGNGIGLTVLFDQSEYTSQRFNDLVTNLLLGITMVAIILFITLGWRAALIVVAAIPLTALVSLWVLQLLKIPIHQMSVTGLIVALGLLVDAAIVMVDAIQRRLTKGLSAPQAIRESVASLWVPLLSSTLTTVFGFMPIMLLEGASGEFVGPIAISVIVALIASFLLAIFVLPAIAGRSLEGVAASMRATPARDQHFWQAGLSFPPLTRWFKSALDWSLRRPVSAILATLILPVLGFVGMTTLTSQFFPEADRDQFTIELLLPPRTSIEQTRSAVLEAHAMLMARDDVKEVTWYLGESAPKFYYNLAMSQDGVPNFAEAQVTATSLRGIKDQIRDVQAELTSAFPGAQVLVRQILQGPPTFAPVELRFYGPDREILKELGEEARLLLSELPDVVLTQATLGSGSPKLWVNADEDQARQAGLSLVDVARQLDGQLEGAFGGSVVEGSEELPVRVRVGNATRRDLSQIRSIDILSPSAVSSSNGFSGIPLDALGALELAPSRDTLSRLNGERVNTVSGYVQAGTLPATTLEQFMPLWAERIPNLPAGYRMEIGGDSEERSDAVGNLMSSVGLIVVLMLTTIVLTFNSFRLTAVVFAVAFQAIGLGLLCLTIFDFPFGFQPIVALVGLTGVAINAAIIIMSRLRRDPAAVAGEARAIRDGVMETSRHITSTTITTFAGFLPLILSDGGFWPPFATAIAGGVLLSTIVSFFFVPPLFMLITKRRPVTEGHRPPSGEDTLLESA